MKPVCVGSAIGSAICERCIVQHAFIFIPFGVGCKKSVFIDVLANIRGTQLGLKRKSDWNLIPQLCGNAGQLVALAAVNAHSWPIPRT